MRTLLVLAVLSLTPSTTFAQDDARWLPWLGCWQSAVERLTGDTVCVVPSGAGVKMLVVAGDELSTDQTIVADATDRPVDEPSCTGVSRAEWSHAGNMLFTRVEQACVNRPSEKVSGLYVFMNGPVWVDIQIGEAAGRSTAVTRRYSRVSIPESLAGMLPDELMARAIRAAEQLAETSLAVKDIIEANGKVASAAIETALFETKTQFALNNRALIALSEAGVTENVIDLMLAISYPSHFEVNRWAAVPQSPETFYGATRWDDWSFGHPMWRLHPLSESRFYQSPYYYSGWNLYYFPRGNSAASAGSFTVSPPLAAEQSGSVVKGQGYTRGRPGDPGSAAASGSQAGSTRGKGSVVAPRSSSSSGSSNAGSSGKGSSSGGYSSGSSSGSGGGGGRTAVARE